MDIVHCNACFAYTDLNVARNYIITDCGHIFCENCGSQVLEKRICSICKITCPSVKLDPESMTSHLKEYFQDPLQVIERAMRIVAFQEKHCSILMKFHGKRYEDYQLYKLTNASKTDQVRNLERKLKFYKGEDDLSTQSLYDGPSDISVHHQRDVIDPAHNERGLASNHQLSSTTIASANVEHFTDDCEHIAGPPPAPVSSLDVVENKRQPEFLRPLSVARRMQQQQRTVGNVDHASRYGFDTPESSSSEMKSRYIEDGQRYRIGGLPRPPGIMKTPTIAEHYHRQPEFPDLSKRLRQDFRNVVVVPHNMPRQTSPAATRQNTTSTTTTDIDRSSKRPDTPRNAYSTHRRTRLGPTDVPPPAAYRITYSGNYTKPVDISGNLRTRHDDHTRGSYTHMEPPGGVSKNVRERHHDSYSNSSSGYARMEPSDPLCNVPEQHRRRHSNSHTSRLEPKADALNNVPADEQHRPTHYYDRYNK